MTDWDQLMPMHTRYEREVQMATLDGYCLGLEEFLKATRTLPGMTMTESEARARREIRKVASKQLDGCRRALKRLKGLSYASDDSTQRTSGEAGSGLGPDPSPE